MKKNLFLTSIVLFILILFLQNSFSQLVLKKLLPHGAIAHLELSQVYDIEFSPDGKNLAVVDRHGTSIYDTSTYEKLAHLDNTTKSVAFSPDGKMLVSGNNLLYLQTGTFRDIAVSHGGRGGVAFSPDGLTFATGGDSNIHLWDAKTGVRLKTFEDESHSWGNTYVSSLAFSPDGLTLASDNKFYDVIRLWDVKTGKYREIENEGEANCVAFSPDGQTLASGGVDYPVGSIDYPVRLWDVKTGERLKTFIGHTGKVESVAFSPDGQTLASGSDDRTVRLWDIKTGEQLKEFVGHTHEIESVAFSPDGLILASGGLDNNLFFWGLSPDTPKPVASKPDKPAEDINDDGIANILDLVQIAGRMGRPANGDPEDVNGDGVINILDLVQVAVAIGN